MHAGRYVLVNGPFQAEVVRVGEGRWVALLERRVLSVFPTARLAMEAVQLRLGWNRPAPEVPHEMEDAIRLPLDGLAGN